LTPIKLYSLLLIFGEFYHPKCTIFIKKIEAPIIESRLWKFLKVGPITISFHMPIIMSLERKARGRRVGDGQLCSSLERERAKSSSLVALILKKKVHHRLVGCVCS
jgi:hypothetical protein